MGGFHARVYNEMPSAHLVGVYDHHRAAAEKTAQTYGVRAFDSLEQMFDQVRAVTIAVPTIHHAEVAKPFIERGIPCLIEKPLAPDSRQGRLIADWAAQYKTLVQVGHIERFNPAILAADRLHLAPRFIEAVRISPMTFRSLDVGVVLDMMIHDIDIVLKFAASGVSKVDAVGTGLLGSAEDVCNARLTFENGCVANITASRMALKTERRLRLFSADAFVSIDYQKRQGVIARRSDNLQLIRDAAQQANAGTPPNYTDLVKLEPLGTDPTDPLRAQLEAFLHAVATKSPSPVPAEAALAAVQVAERIVQQITSGSANH
jgi:predicted dehydrogenase